MTPPVSLADPGLGPLWAMVRDRLERRGSASRGRVHTPVLTTGARHSLTSLLGRPLTATIDLSALEQALVRVGAGGDLLAALEALGHPMSFEAEVRRSERRQARDARDAARAACREWPETWALSWIDEVIRNGVVRGLDTHGAVRLVGDVRRCLDALGSDHQPRSKVDLAAVVLGDSHALDPGTRVGVAMTRALRQRFADDVSDDADRTVWDRAGAPADSVSAPVLTWNLPVHGDGPMASVVNAAAAAGVVVHLSEMLLRAHPVVVAADAIVLVTENPRIVEAAAQRRVPFAVVSTNGNPSTAVRLLLIQLLATGAGVRYHGDFDAAGLSICRRMAQFGLRPWKMDAADYSHAVDEAERSGVVLPLDDADPGPTPWDPELADLFRSRRRVVHEERVAEILLRADPP